MTSDAVPQLLLSSSISAQSSESISQWKCKQRYDFVCKDCTYIIFIKWHYVGSKEEGTVQVPYCTDMPNISTTVHKIAQSTTTIY